MSRRTWVPSYYREMIQPRLPWFLENAGNKPHILISLEGINQAASSMNRAFSRLPVVHRQYYAFKAFADLEVSYYLRHHHGFGMDCSSPDEKEAAMRIGCGPEDIMYSSNRTTTEELSFVLGDGGCLINYDDITTPDRVVGVFPHFACFRLASPVGGNIIGGKYGIRDDQIIPAYRKVMELGAREFGLHSMIASNTKDNAYFLKILDWMLKKAALLHQELGIKVRFVNIGGGFGIPYRPTDKKLDLRWIATEMKKRFERFGEKQGFMPWLLTECGRYITGPHGFLIQRIISKEEKYGNFLGVESAMTGCPRPAFYGAYHHIEVYSPDGKLRTGRRGLFHVAGPKCEGWDMLTAKDEPRWLPLSSQVGDIIVVFNCGAHVGTVMGDNYNWRRLLATYLDQDGTNEGVIMTRRAQVSADLFQYFTPSKNFVLPGQG